MQWEWGQDENLQDSWGSDTNRLGRGISDLSYTRKSVDSQALNEGDATGRRGYNLLASLCASPLHGPSAVPATSSACCLYLILAFLPGYSHFAHRATLLPVWVPVLHHPT